MTSKSSAPTSPDPYATAQAQTGSDIATAISNSYMGNADQYSPYGSTTFQQTGTQTVTDPSSGQTYSVPTWSQTTSLSPGQQQMYNLQTQAGIGLDQLANSQISNLSNIMNTPFTYSSDTPSLVSSIGSMPNYQDISLNGINLQSNIGDAGPVQSSYANAGPIQTSVSTDFSGDAQKATDAVMSRLSPEYDREKAQLETTLVNEGYQRGSDAYNQQMDEFNRQQNDALQQAVLSGYDVSNQLATQAINAGNFANSAQAQNYSQLQGNASFANAAQQQLYNELSNNANFYNTAQTTQQGFNNTAQQAQADFNNANQTNLFNAEAQQAAFQNAARTQSIQEQTALRQEPINEVSSLLSGGQVTMPSFTPYQYSPMQSTPVGQYVYDTAALDQQNYQTQVSQQNALLSGLFGLGSTGIYSGVKYSDRRLKQNIVDLGIRLMNGAKLYAYEYLGQIARTVGVMADEIEKIMPAAVVQVGDFKAVNYAAVWERGLY